MPTRQISPMEPADPPDGVLAWTRNLNLEAENETDGGLNVVAYADKDVGYGWRLELVHRAQQALEAMSYASGETYYWKLDADYAAPMLLTRGAPREGEPVALVCPRVPEGSPEDAEAATHEPVGGRLDTIGIDSWPVWFRAPDAQQEVPA